MHIYLNKGIVRVPLLGINNLDDIRLPDLSEVMILEQLRLLCTSKIMEALYVSSPEFTRVLEEIIDKNEKKIAHTKLLEIWLTFVKYYTRMSSRGTPYGLMASVGIISLNKKTTLQKEFNGIIHAQLDNAIVANLSYSLEKSDHLKAKLIYFANPSIYKHANKLKYIEVLKKDGDKVFALSKVETNIVIEKTLAYAGSGKNRRDLITFIQRQFVGIYEPNDIDELVSDLISNQLLLSNYSSSSTGRTLFSYLIEKIHETADRQEIEEIISKINEDLNKVQKQDWNNNKYILSGIIHNLQRLNPSNTNNPVFHFNFTRSFSDSAIGNGIINKIKAAVELLASINEPFVFEEMEAFKQAFVRRYENSYVPLTELLDEEIGIGYPVGNIRNHNTDGAFDGIKMPNQDSGSATDLYFNPFYTFLFDKISELKVSNSTLLEISSEDIKGFGKKTVRLPPTFSIFCSLLGESPEEIDKGNYKVILSNSAYTSASSPINRFAVSDTEIETFCKEIFEYENQLFKNQIVAEVLHIPNSRLENITFRKVTRDFEIPIETLSNSDPEKQIFLNDILVNVVNNNIRLIRRKDKKEIIPRISNSHAFTNADSLPAYRFLGGTQLQNQQNYMLWQWGPLSKLDFLPRVVLDKNIICCLATWKVKLDKSLFLENIDISGRLKDQLFRIGLPRYVSLRQNGDNLLTLDLEDPSCLLILIREFKKYPFLIFHENLSSPDNSFIKDKNGNSYINELIIPFLEQIIDEKKLKVDAVKHLYPNYKEKRSFFPGDEFLYLKIYCTKNIGQLVLIQSLEKILSDSEYRSFPIFFIRYEDPDFHIRVRIHKKENSLLIPKIYKSLNRFIKNKFIHKIQIDTYERELDRYSLVPYYKSELIFSVDSRAVLDILKYLNKINLETATWIIAIKNVYTYLVSFGMSPEEMLSFCLAIRNGFFSELNLVDKEFLKSLNVKLKENFTLISGVIKETNPNYKKIYGILSRRTSSISKILNVKERKKIGNHFGQCSSYIHMSLNRLFASDERFKEAMCYDFLYNFLSTEKRIEQSNRK